MNISKIISNFILLTDLCGFPPFDSPIDSSKFQVLDEFVWYTVLLAFGAVLFSLYNGRGLSLFKTYP